MKTRTENVKDYLKKIDDANIEINKIINNESNEKLINETESIIPVDVDDFLNTYNNTLDYLSKSVQIPNTIDNLCNDYCTTIREVQPQIISDKIPEYTPHITKIEFNEYSDIVGYKSMTHDTSNMFNCILTLNTIDDEEIIITGDKAYTKLSELLNIVKESEKIEI
jgi:hypothetical protein